MCLGVRCVQVCVDMFGCGEVCEGVCRCVLGV